MLGLEAYERDLCPGCGWPRTYTMHKDAKRHWSATNGHRCHACTAKGKAEDANDSPRGLFFTAVPDDGLMHAMADPVLTYKDDDDRVIVGASGLVRHVPAPPPPLDDDE